MNTFTQCKAEREVKTMDLFSIKNELLCLGVSCSEEIIERIREVNPYASMNKCVHSAFFSLDSQVWVNTPINERYTQRSPYSIDLQEERFVLLKDANRICYVTIQVPPKWYGKKTKSGMQMYDVLSVHNKDVIALTNFADCYYATIGKQCLYCSVKKSSIPQILDFNIRKQDIAETVEEAIKENKDYSLTLSEGVKYGNDRGALYFSSILDEITKHGISIKTSVELAPPSSNYYLDLLFSSGVTSVIMNLEFSSDEVRKRFCPGKSEIGIDKYINALKYAVNLFGIGSVASVLIAGIEPSRDTIDCAKYLMELGVLPIIIPFKPYDNCKLSNMPTVNPEDFEMISRELHKYYGQHKYTNVCKHSCISCCACNAGYFIEQNRESSL